MQYTRLTFVSALIVGLAGTHLASAEMVPGEIDSASGPGWASAWMNLDQAQNFRKGERLCLRIGGSRSVLVRLLPEGGNPSRSVGIDKGIREVPDSGALEITLATDHHNTRQISVHGGETAWSWQFLDGNLPPTLSSIERISGDQTCR